jgi:tRNA (guanine-N7-)-methyltransferase
LGDATLIISQFIREGSAKRFYINNPDPWPKDKHEKNRIINFGFLDHIFNLLSRKGDLVIKSDDLKYIDYIRTEISKSKFKTTFDYHEKLPPTKFQTSYAKKRVPIHTIYSRKN